VYGGVDFALISYMEYDDSTPDDWHNVGALRSWLMPLINWL
jgi:hypothetical protein